MRLATRAAVTKLLHGIEAMARDYIAAGNEHAPTLFCLRKERKKYKVDVVMLTPTANDTEKDAAALACGQVVEPFDAYIHLTEGWRVQLPAGADINAWLAAGRRASTEPDRVEILSLHFVSRLGEQLFREFRIVREDGKAPRLEFERESEQPMEGRCANFYDYAMPATVGTSQ